MLNWNKLKGLTNIIAIVAVVILLITNLKQCNKIKEGKDQIKQFDLTFAALNDTIKKTKNKEGKTIYVQQVPSMDLDVIINSEAYKSLSKEKQNYLQQLKKTKGLLADAEYRLTVQDSIIKSQGYKDTVKVNNSLICYRKGHSLLIPGGNQFMTFNHTISFKDSLESKLTYRYSADIKTTFVRKKDKSIVVEYSTNDTAAVFTNGNSFIIPQEKKTWWDKNKGYIIGGMSFIGGMYIGTQIK